MQESKQTRDMFLTRALEKILNDKEIRRSHNSNLKEECKKTLDKIKNELKASGKDESSFDEFTPIEADSYFPVFELACKSRSPSIVSNALDCLQKMIMYGMLVGSTPDSDSPTNQPLINRVITAICKCFDGVNTDEGVQLQIIKVLLTAVTGNNCEVHEATLLLAVRTCYNIYLASRNLVNQNTARVTLTQMLNAIFSRMEAQAVHDEKLAQELQLENGDDAVTEEVVVTDGASKPIVINSTESCVVNNGQDTTLQETSFCAKDSRNNVIKEKCSGEDIETTQEESQNNNEQGDGADDDNEDFGAFNGGYGDEIAGGDLGDDVTTVVAQILDELVDNVVNPPTVEPEKPVENGDVKPEAEESQTPSIASESETNTTLSKENQENEEVLRRNLSVSHVLQKDAFLVFRSFCKLSMKVLSEGPPDPKSHELRSKVLSLHLLSSILETAGPVFRNNDMFISAIKQYLCVALSKNAVSSVPEVFKLSLDIFVKLLEFFKTHLKMQIQVFFKEIFLNILDSSSSSLLHKRMVLDALLQICSDPQSIVDIYVNYDCDMSAANIFEQLVSLLCKTAQIANAPSSATAVEVKKMRKKSLECLVTLVSGLTEWCGDLYVNPQTIANLGKEHQTELGQQKTLQVMGGGGGNMMSSNQGSSRSLHSDSSDPANSNPNLFYDNPETLEVTKQQKGILEQGIQKFNTKPNKGIVFLQTSNMIGSTPADIAKFLQTELRLDPAMVGEYLGENEKLNKEVMYAYVDALDFSSLDFVTAIRIFLEGFRIPGEAQKIDRLMEKFASRYLDCNPHGTVFASADAAYVLAYSIIMLTTDLHNSQVKRKMTNEDYIKMNRGINDSKDLPREYLEEIYFQISKKAISIKGRSKTAAIKGATSAAQRMREMQEMADNAKVLMEAASHVQAEFICTKHLEHVRPMFKGCWNPLMAAFSIGFHYIDDREATLLCLSGLQHSIRIACIFGLSLERDSLINTLSRFSLLEDTVGIRELEWKNREAIKALIQIACTDGNYLQQSWETVLKCISHLDLIQSIGSGVKDQTTTAIKKSASITDSSPILTKTFGMEHKRLATIQESMGETSSQSYVVAVDRIFTGSAYLDGDAIVDFVDCLCKVSTSELKNPLRPRKFSLIKLVEISYYNMGRIRIQWARIWHHLGEHFNEVGCREFEEVAIFAVDSLRQMSTKFLEKGELPGFGFQKDFLRPFEHIVKKNPRSSIKEMVVFCISQMVDAQKHNIKSGWKNIFSVFAIAASLEDEQLVGDAFTKTSDIITNHFQFYFTSIIHCFQDAISALREFSCSLFPDISMEAIRLIRECASYVAEKPKYFEDLTGDEPQYGAQAGDKIWVRGWFPIFFELSYIINRCKLDVRTRGLTVMFEIMKTYGDTFEESWWHDLFQIIFRIFDQMKMPEVQIERTDWFSTTCNHALFSICDVFTQFYSTLAPTLLRSVYDQLLWCIEKENEQLARSGVNCFENLIISNGSQFDVETWELTCEKASKIFEIVSPNELLTWSPNRSNTPSKERTELKKLQLYCVLTSEMIECIDNFLFLPKATKSEDEANLALATSDEISNETREPGELLPQLNEKQLLTLVQCLHRSHDLAKRFNTNVNQRDLLWKAGFKGKTKPNLIRQETTSLTCALRILFRLNETDPTSENIFKILSQTCRIAINYYITITTPQHRESWSNILLLILAKLLRMPDEHFTKLQAVLHVSLCDILLFELRSEVRLVFRKYLIRTTALSATS